MNKDQYIALIFKKLKGAISLEEQSQLDIWIGQSTENQGVYHELKEDWELTQNYESAVEVALDVDADFKKLQQRIQISENTITAKQDNLRVAHQPIGKVVQMNSKPSSRRWIGWASAAVILLALGFWFTNTGNSNTSNNIALETQYQERKEVQLADGTKVWLNGDSKLAYPTEFTGTNRVVQLTGEAFFDVQKNPAMPFIIETPKAKVTVLGTSFNVRARTAELNTEVVVKTGKVRLENLTGDQKVELIKDQVGVYSTSQNTIEKKVSTDKNALAWMGGKLIFKGDAIEDVLFTLERQFDVKISLINPRVKDCSWDGIYDTNNGVKVILDNLAKDFDMSLKTLGNTTFELEGGACNQ